MKTMDGRRPAAVATRPPPPAERGREATGTQAIARAIEVIRQVASANGAGLRLADVARTTGLSAPTAHRIASALVDGGLLRKDADARRYRLGDFAIGLGLLSDPMMRLRETCRPYLARLAQETGDTAFLVLRSGADAVCVDRVEGPFPIRALTLDVGSCRPLGVGAAGLAILSSLSAEQRAAVYAERREAVYAFERLAIGELERMALAAHQVGYAVSSGVVLPGVIGVGRVLRLPGTALAAISVAAISQRLDAARIEAVAALLAREVAGLERHFGVERPEGRAA
jgi:DNA-binding IclR family transcriptional regulator